MFDEKLDFPLTFRLRSDHNGTMPQTRITNTILRIRYHVLRISVSFSLIILAFLHFPFLHSAFAADHTYYIHSDQLGSVMAVTDESGNSVKQIAYAPYGKDAQIKTAQSQVIEKGYTGQIKDNNTTLSYYNARYYDPILSRFISADSVQGGNRFAYVGGNPISKSDPSGNRVLEDEDMRSTTQLNFGQIDPVISTQNNNTSNFAASPISAGLPISRTNSSNITNANQSPLSTSNIPRTGRQPLPFNHQSYRNGNYSINLDFDDPYFQQLGASLGVTTTISGSEYDYAVQLGRNIYKDIPYAQDYTDYENAPAEDQPQIYNQIMTTRNNLKTFSNLLKNNKAVCEEQSIAYAYFLNQSGIPAEVMHLPDVHHAVVSATVDSKIAIFDATNGVYGLLDSSKSLPLQVDQVYHEQLPLMLSYPQQYQPNSIIHVITHYYPGLTN